MEMTKQFEETKNEDWRCNGWADHERAFREAGKMSPWARQLLREDLEEFMRRLSFQRRWLDERGVIHAAIERSH